MSACIPRAVVITTFQGRFAECLRLVEELRDEQVEEPIFVAVNGDFPNGGHDELARSLFLRKLVKFSGINPVCLGSGRGLSYVLNASLRLAHAEKMVVLADDCVFLQGAAGRVVARMFRDLDDSDCAIVNNDMGHFAVSRVALDRVGWFSELLPGIGWEDSDFIYRMVCQGWGQLKFREDKEVWNSGATSGFDDIVPEKDGSKYSLLNRIIMRSFLWNFKKKAKGVDNSKVTKVGEVDLSNLPPVQQVRSPRLHPFPFERLHEQLWHLHKSSDFAEIHQLLGQHLKTYLGGRIILKR